MKARIFWLAILLPFTGCSGASDQVGSDGGPTGGRDQAGALDAPADLTLTDGPGDTSPFLEGLVGSDIALSGPDTSVDARVRELPFSYTRPGVGDPVTAAELAAVTDRYIALLEQTRFFDVVDERVHGWPRSDPQQRYWYGTWWSLVDIVKSGGKVTYLHGAHGANNNGLRTGPLLEGVCFAHRLWGSAKLEQIARRLVRGLNSWILAMERQANDPVGTLLARSAYPEPVVSTDGGRELYIDYAATRPGDENPATDYVHLPSNPYWGDIWIKNKRSKDCIGHMLRAMATLEECRDTFGAATQQDHAEMVANYTSWARRVEDDGWVIATYDTNAQLWYPPDVLARFIGLANAECDAMLAMRLLGRGDPGAFSCGNGIHPLEWIVLQNDHNGEIARSFHEAGIKQALLTDNPAIALDMLQGLAQRLDEGMAMADSGDYPVHLEPVSLADLIAHAANAGVPLTWREVRWFHQQIEQAYEELVTNTPPTYYRVFDPITPDGAYPFTPWSSSINFRSLALPIGSCVAAYRNPTSAPLLDCARLRAWTP